MEGLSNQLRLLSAALQPLDLSRPIAEDSGVTSELQMLLARATALAQRAVAIQQTGKDGWRRGSDSDCAGAQKASQPNGNAHRAASDVSHDAPAERDDETLLSVATAFRVLVEDLRKWNPQLPDTLSATDVLPPNTYLKVQQAAHNASADPPLQQPSILRRSSSATQPIPRLAAPPSMSPSATRTSSGNCSEQLGSHPRNGSGAAAAVTVAGLQTRSSVPSTGSSTSNLLTATSVNASVNSNLSGSAVMRWSDGGGTMRLSMLAGESGRGASHSASMLEPSMLGPYSSADPPACAPTPFLMGMVEVLSSSADETDVFQAGSLNFSVDEPSPSPERQEAKAVAVGKMRGASVKQPSPVLLQREPTTSPSPVSAAVPPAAVTHVAAAHARPGLPQSLQQQQRPDAVGNGGGSPCQASVSTNDSGTTARTIRTRSRSASQSNSPTARPAEQVAIAAPRGHGAAATSTHATSLVKCAAVFANDATSKASQADSTRTGHTNAKANRLTSPDVGADCARVVPDALVEASALHKDSEGEEALKRLLRDPSVSLSAVSAATSTSCERNSSVRTAEHSRGAAAGPAPRRPANSPTFVTSPSLAAPSSASSVSPLHNGARQQVSSTVPPYRPAAAESAETAAASADFSTPIQQHRRRRRTPPSQRGAAAGSAAACASCSPISPASSTSSDRLRDNEASDDDSEASSSPATSGSDLDDDEIEDTPSVLIPAMLGRCVCSPPPMLSRTWQSNASPNDAASVNKAGLWDSTNAQARSRTPSSPSPSGHTPTACGSDAAEMGFSNKGGNSAKQSSPSASLSWPKSQEQRSLSNPQAGRQGTGRGGAVQPASSMPQKDCLAAEFAEEAPMVERKEGAEAEMSDMTNGGGFFKEEEGAGEESEYDTLEGIAATYKLTPAVIVEWNPYLKKYRPNEPLPPDLPIVLPMSDNDDEEEGEDALGDHDAEVKDEEEEFYREGDAGYLRHSGTPLGTAPMATGESPVPVLPTRC
ncbi:hypothetical protein ABL78_5819 [Leptomonas seymouri]|uniref:LysM domain-containing protein n=1 Tax=Leptomonas seymouri TaxID=5684 RepID=A0A0N0P4C2_LEPSE|nr:hypothetical protein ABL78_5819 [Leptomonas seymouri]|eukprot:KPI85126.1 hypothetical protein ABL78_5819 [Leptomonas seymouri]